MSEKKWLKIGQVTEQNGKNGTFESITLENENLKELVLLLKQFGQDRIGDMSVDDIRKAQKLKRDDPNYLPRLQISRFDKTDEDRRKGCPDFVLADLLVKIEQF